MAVVNGTPGNDDLYGTAESDVIQGLPGNDTLTGHAGNDTLYGGAGNDVLVGGAGDDLLDGGEGIDQVLYYRETGPRGVQVNLQTGTAIDTTGNTDRLVSIEQVHGSNRGDSLTGGQLTGDMLYGWGGDDLIQGLGGDDTLVGGEGADTLDGGTGTDQVAYFLETGTQGVRVNLQDGTAVDTFGTIDRLIGIEQVHGSNFADTLTGSAGNDMFFGRDGNDLLQGLAGNDTLIGGAGNDTLNGGAGTDQVAYFLDGGTRGVNVNLELGIALDTYGDTDTLISIEQIHGSDFADTLIGNAEGNLFFGRDGNDIIRGGAGVDTLVGGRGNDTLDGGADDDQVAYFLEDGTRGVHVDMRSGIATDTYGDTDTLVSIENVHGSNNNDTILGSDGDDRINGRDGDDYIDGRDGSNLIYTGGGNDHVVVGTDAEGARDTVVINGLGNKVITGYGSNGTRYGHHLVFDLPEAVHVNLATGIARSANMTLDFSQALHFLEVGGTAFDDYIIGGNPAHDHLEWLSGNQGNDTLDGGSGTANTVIYDDEVEYGAFNHITQRQEFGDRGVHVNLATGVATDTFGFTDTLIRIDDVRATRFVDVLIGNDKDNAFWGLKGADTINGGGGIDRVHYREDYLTGGTRGVLVNLAEGYAIDGFGDRDTLISIEEAYGTDYNDTMTGDAGDNRLYGYNGTDSLYGGAGRDTLNGGSGHDVLYGGAGDDELWGEEGNDTLDGGAGNDAVRYLGALRGINANLATGVVADGYGTTDTLISIEGLYGSEHADTIQGGNGAETLSGLDGNDRIYGGGGNDTILGGGGDDSLVGGAGDDELWGGAGNDTIDGGAGNDLVRYRDAKVGISVDLAAGTARDGEGGSDRLISIENIDGSDFGDHIRGDAQNNRLFGYAGNDTLEGGGGADVLLGGEGNDQLFGGAGDDELWGGRGNDTLDGGAGSDLVRYRDVEAGVRVDLTAGTAQDGQGGTDRLISIENVDGSDHADVLRGNADANRLFGYAGSDEIYGLAGNDVLLGGEGDDLLYGGEGDDELWGEAGNDTLDGGAGHDMVRYRNSTSAVQVNLAAGTAQDGLGGRDVLISIEEAHGSDFGDRLTGNADANRLFGYAGNDTLQGGLGDDVLSGGAGNDTYIFRAGDGRDIINDLGDATVGSDRLIVRDYAAANASVIQQGNSIVLDFRETRDAITLANNTTAGGAGTIEFIEFADGTVWTHATLLSKVGQVGTPLVTRLATEGNDTLFGTPEANLIDGGAGHDVIHGMAGNDTLHGGAGNDTIYAGSGNNLVYGGAGNDTIYVGPGNDSIYGGAGTDTVVFDTSFAALGDDFSVTEGRVATVAGSRIEGVEVFRFADRDLTAQQLYDLARNAVPVSTLPARVTTREGAIAVDLKQWFRDPENDPLTFEIAELPAGIRLDGSVLRGTLQAELSGAPHTIVVSVSDGTHVVRHSFDWLIENVNAAPAGRLTISGSAVTRQTLTAVSTITDGDGIDAATLQWTWLRDGVAIPGATGQSYEISDLDAGRKISVSMSYTDLFGTAESVTSAVTAPVAAAALWLTGTAGNDVLRGGSGHDTLFGLAGNDLLEGGEGNDELRGGDGNDTLIGGAGNDTIYGGDTEADLRDMIYGGAGDDLIFGGYGNDELRGDLGNDTLNGDQGADMLIGGAGDDVLSGGALGDELHGGDGADWLNGGFGFDRLNGGAGADVFYHLGVFDHGSDWIQDYNAAEGDVLSVGIAGATRSQFQINVANTPKAGSATVAETFIIYRPTGQILFALVDGAGQDQINMMIGGKLYDLLA